MWRRIGLSVQLHSDTLNEAVCGGYDQGDRGRTIHTYHSEGAGGGHAPDIMGSRRTNIIPSSTNPTKSVHGQYRCGASSDEMAAHNLNPRVPEDVAFADSRIRGETKRRRLCFTIMGAISIMASDSQGMGEWANLF
jgi:urease subunit alpha